LARSAQASKASSSERTRVLSQSKKISVICILLALVMLSWDILRSSNLGHGDNAESRSGSFVYVIGENVTAARVQRSMLDLLWFIGKWMQW
jgi:predicted ABC-type sugar transport system permease subunit